MKKSSPTPKELSKMRISRSKLMKIPKNEGNFDKGNVNPIRNLGKSTYKVHNREVKDGERDPFDIPAHMRMFSTRKTPRKPKPEPFIMSEPHTICDVDPLFYKIIEGRPIRDIIDVKVYMRDIRDLSLFKADSSYLKDEIIMIDTKIATELREYNEIEDLYVQCKKNFIQFARESYENAKKIRALAEIRALELANMTDKLEAYCFMYVKIRNKMAHIAAIFDTLASYSRFLNTLTPQWWREDFDTNSLRRESIISFKEFTIVADESVSSLDVYKMKMSKYAEIPPMFFKEPEQIMSLFDDIERQCLNYMKIDVLTSTMRKSILGKRDVLKAEVAWEITEMEELVEIYKNKIKYYEEKEEAYKEVFYRLLLTEFQDLYSSYDNVKLFTCVQYAVTQIIGNPEDPKDSVVTLMFYLERLYLSLSLGLDELDNDVVKEATRVFFARDIKMMNLAYKAQRTLKECDIFKKALEASVEPSRRRRDTKKSIK